MTFEDIQKRLGGRCVDEISRSVLLAAQRAKQSDDPAAHTRALLELMTALLAVLLHRDIEIDGRGGGQDESAAEAATASMGRRLNQLLESMQQIEARTMAATPARH